MNGSHAKFFQVGIRPLLLHQSLMGAEALSG